jgi:hypothetical protein
MSYVTYRFVYTARRVNIITNSYDVTCENLKVTLMIPVNLRVWRVHRVQCQHIEYED